MRRLLALLLFVVASCSAPVAEAPPDPTPHELLQGVWRVAEIKNLDTGEVAPEQVQYHVFTGSHHMIVLAGMERPKIEKSLSDMSPEEFMSQQPVGAGFYRYSVNGEKLTRTNVIALSAYYEGKTFETEFEASADGLVLRDRHAADGALRQWTLTRVE